MIDLLTEQIAGLYDPKAREFYVADWIPLDDQRMVMAHELTHALQDQHFQIEAWVKAARPNDDAEMAREAVLEGSAMAAMIDYLLKGTGRSVEDLPPFDPAVFAGDLSKTPKLQEAPQFLKDSLIFPYFGRIDLFGGDPEKFAVEWRCRRFLPSLRFRRSRSCIRLFTNREKLLFKSRSLLSRKTAWAGLDEN